MLGRAGQKSPFPEIRVFGLRRKIYEGVSSVRFGILDLIRNPMFPWNLLMGDPQSPCFKTKGG